METKQSKEEILEKWRQETCFGDDVECTVSDAVQLMISHLNDHQLLRHPNLRPITQVDFGNSDTQIRAATDMIYQVEQVMIKAGLEKIYQIEKGQVE